MENKNILVDTLRMLAKDRQRHKFVLSSIRKRRAELSVEEENAQKCLSDIENRIRYNIEQHGELLK